MAARSLLVILAVAASLCAQTQRRSIRATGEGEISVRPDQARINVSVVTQAATAAEASQANATQTQAVIDAVRALIGTAGQIRTSASYVTPYSEGNPPRQAGYRVTNTISVTANNTALAGRIIDTAVAAGANRIDSLSLGLQDDEPVRLQALRAAGQVARARAEAIAAGLGVRLGGVLSADTSVGGIVAPVGRLAAGAAATPIEAGNLTVTALIAVEYEIAP